MANFRVKLSLPCYQRDSTVSLKTNPVGQQVCYLSTRLTPVPLSLSRQWTLLEVSKPLLILHSFKRTSHRFWVFLLQGNCQITRVYLPINPAKTPAHLQMLPLFRYFWMRLYALPATTWKQQLSWLAKETWTVCLTLHRLETSQLEKVPNKSLCSWKVKPKPWVSKMSSFPSQEMLYIAATRSSCSCWKGEYH